MEIKPLIYDTIFKAVFLKEKEVLLKMIKDIVDIEEDISIQNIEIIPGYELVAESKNSRIYKTDILIKLSDDSYINLEINNRNSRLILSRNILQIARIFSNIIEKGTDLQQLSGKTVKQLNFNTFKTFTGKPMEKICLCESESNKIISEIFSIFNLDVDKSLEMTYNNDEKVNLCTKWGALVRTNSLEYMNKLLEEGMVSMERKEHFIETIKEVNNDKKILEDWMIEENARLSYEGELAYAKEEGLEEGKKKGLEEGKKKGLEEGKKKGLEEGKKKGLEDGLIKGKKESIIEIIKNMIANNFNYEIISKITGSSIKEIELISKQI